MAIRIINVEPRAVNRPAAVNNKPKRGAYPATDARRAYMAEFMRRRRGQERVDAILLAQVD